MHRIFNLCSTFADSLLSEVKEERIPEVVVGDREDNDDEDEDEDAPAEE